MVGITILLVGFELLTKWLINDLNYLFIYLSHRDKNFNYF